MNEHTYQLVELTGTSGTSIEEAVQNALAKTSKMLPNLRWFQVVETRGAIKDGAVSEWQVTIKVGSRLEA